MGNKKPPSESRRECDRLYSRCERWMASRRGTSISTSTLSGTGHLLSS